MSLPGLTRQSITLDKGQLFKMAARVNPRMTRITTMPMIDADGLLNVSVEGRDGGPTLMLSNSLGCNLQMWEPQMKALTEVFRVIRYDRRGHGRSSVPPGPYSVERFGRDVLAILDDLNIEKVHWCGLSMGGMVGQWLGANAPERFGKIILANTTCYYPDPTRWHERIKAVKEGGMAAVADAVIGGWLTADFREREPQVTANMKAMLLASPIASHRLLRALSALDRATCRHQNPRGCRTPGGNRLRRRIIRSRIRYKTLLDGAHIDLEQPSPSPRPWSLRRNADQGLRWTTRNAMTAVYDPAPQGARRCLGG
jgi:3-oxoadipate enol-lactonase